jgi:hypothetical protein
MIIKAVKFCENGFMTQPFAFGGEEGPDKFDSSIKYRSSLQNYIIDTGSDVILVDTGLPKETPEMVPDEFKKTNTIKQLKVKFNRESFLNDVLTCTTYKTDTPKLYVHKIEKDGISVCDISTLWEEKTDTSTIVDYPLKIKG